MRLYSGMWILWTGNRRSAVCGKYVQREVKDGSIILMHDSFSSSVEAALQIADMLTEQGYDLVTADELLVM